MTRVCSVSNDDAVRLCPPSDEIRLVRADILHDQLKVDFNMAYGAIESVDRALSRTHHKNLMAPYLILARNFSSAMQELSHGSNPIAQSDMGVISAATQCAAGTLPFLYDMAASVVDHAPQGIWKATSVATVQLMTATAGSVHGIGVSARQIADGKLATLSVFESSEFLSAQWMSAAALYTGVKMVAGGGGGMWNGFSEGSEIHGGSSLAMAGVAVDSAALSQKASQAAIGSALAMAVHGNEPWPSKPPNQPVEVIPDPTISVPVPRVHLSFMQLVTYLKNRLRMSGEAIKTILRNHFSELDDFKIVYLENDRVVVHAFAEVDLGHFVITKIGVPPYIKIEKAVMKDLGKEAVFPVMGRVLSREDAWALPKFAPEVGPDTGSVYPSHVVHSTAGRRPRQNVVIRGVREVRIRFSGKRREEVGGNHAGLWRPIDTAHVTRSRPTNEPTPRRPIEARGWVDAYGVQHPAPRPAQVHSVPIPPTLTVQEFLELVAQKWGVDNSALAPLVTYIDKHHGKKGVLVQVVSASNDTLNVKIVSNGSAWEYRLTTRYDEPLIRHADGRYIEIRPPM